MAAPVTEFYDRLSPECRDNMGWDWEAEMREEGVSLDRFLANRVGRRGPWSVLDCSCGIGAQAIGLALQGHQVHATDLSPVAIDCARREATDHGVAMTFGVADFRKLSATVSDIFDVVISCDNSIAHCLDDDDLAAALASMKTRLKPDGLPLLSIRDHDALVVDKPRFNNEHVDDRPDGRRVVFQVWDWAGNLGGMCTEDDDDDDDYGYDAEYGMGGDACIHNMARYVAVAPRNVSTSLRYLDFEVCAAGSRTGRAIFHAARYP